MWLECAIEDTDQQGLTTRTTLAKDMARLLGHRQTKGAATDKTNLQLPRHISTLPITRHSTRFTCMTRIFRKRKFANRAGRSPRHPQRPALLIPNPLCGGQTYCGNKLFILLNQSLNLIYLRDASTWTVYIANVASFRMCSATYAGTTLCDSRTASMANAAGTERS
jgi:hypothetical protein